MATNTQAKTTDSLDPKTLRTVVEVVKSSMKDIIIDLVNSDSIRIMRELDKLTKEIEIVIDEPTLVRLISNTLVKPLAKKAYKKNVEAVSGGLRGTPTSIKDQFNARISSWATGGGIPGEDSYHDRMIVEIKIAPEPYLKFEPKSKEDGKLFRHMLIIYKLMLREENPPLSRTASIHIEYRYFRKTRREDILIKTTPIFIIQYILFRDIIDDIIYNLISNETSKESLALLVEDFLEALERLKTIRRLARELGVDRDSGAGDPEEELEVA